MSPKRSSSKLVEKEAKKAKGNTANQKIKDRVGSSEKAAAKRANKLAKKVAREKRYSFKIKENAYSPLNSKGKASLVAPEDNDGEKGEKTTAAPENTPRINRIGHLQGNSTRPLTTEKTKMARKDENEQTVQITLVEGCPNVVASTSPRSSEQRQLAEDAARFIQSEVARCKKEARKIKRRIYQTDAEKAFLKFEPWVRYDSGRQPKKEKIIYKYFSNFLLFIAHVLEHYLEEQGYSVANAVNRRQAKSGEFCGRYIGPCETTDCKPNANDDGSRIDVGMDPVSFSEKIEFQEKPDNRIMFGLMEAKLDINEQVAAYAQLYRYIRQMYPLQIHRRHIYSLTCCGSIVRACLPVWKG